MPEYTYICDKCSSYLEIICSIQQYDTIQNDLRCEHCGSKKLSRNYQNDLASLNTSIKKTDSELKTIGDLAKRNSDKFTDDHKHHLYTKHNHYKDNDTNKKPLPSGMSRMKKQPKTQWPT